MPRLNAKNHSWGGVFFELRLRFALSGSKVLRKESIRSKGVQVQTRAKGVLPDLEIEAMVGRGEIIASLAPDQVQPASLDLALGSVAYRMRASFLPGKGGKIEDAIAALSLTRHDLSVGAVLEPGAVYLVPAKESLALPADVAGRANPKSSTGRIDVFVRTLCDGSERFDEVVAGYAGGVWIEIVPLTFPVVVRTGSRLAQMRFRRGDLALNDDALVELHRREPLVSEGEFVASDGLCFSVDLSAESDGIVGWRACRHGGVVDVDVVGGSRIEDFWEPVRARRGPGKPGMVLEPGQFYILASRECIRVPSDHAAEMLPFDAGVGEFRAHYAGFFDPGFGMGRPSRAVLEVRSREAPFLLEHGQIVGRLVYEPMAAKPRALYGVDLGSNYDGQRLKLSKHFAP